MPMVWSQPVITRGAQVAAVLGAQEHIFHFTIQTLNQSNPLQSSSVEDGFERVEPRSVAELAARHRAFVSHIVGARPEYTVEDLPLYVDNADW